MRNITEVIEKQISIFKFSPRDINGGLCSEFALSVIREMGGEKGNLKYLSIGPFKNPLHAWVLYNGKHYDAENVKGLTNWKGMQAIEGYRGENINIGLDAAKQEKF